MTRSATTPAEPPTAQTNVARASKKNPRCDPPEAKRIVIVDDHPLFRKGLQEMIHSDGTFAVCGEAGNAAEAMQIIRKLAPDMAIVDLSLPGANGIELIKNIRAEFPRLPILVLSMHDESLYAVRALRAGADGYVMKHEALEILELIGKGHEVRQIAKLLHLSPKTVETHRAHIKDKLDLKNSREVARFALQWLNARDT